MDDQQYLLTTSLSYQLKAAREELSAIRSVEACQKLLADYETILRSQNLTIKKLRKFAKKCKEAHREIAEM